MRTDAAEVEAAAHAEETQRPVAIVDIGSNSVRLVAYSALGRALTPIFNEKAMCGLGRGVVTTGRLPDDAIRKALAALRRFRSLCEIMEIADIEVIATAAARDAVNGAAFLAAAQEAIGREISLLSGRREAELSALGVISAIHEPDGVVGDLGGGSLELIDLHDGEMGEGVTLPLGGLALMDAASRSTRQASRIARKAIDEAPPLQRLKGRTFYAVGGTWRALARLHMRQRNYPLDMMHNYRIPTSDAAEFASLLERVDSEALADIAAVSAARRPLLAYGAIVLDEVIRKARPKEIVISAAGVREGLLYERLSPQQRAADPLVAAARELERAMARAPGYGDDLIAWTDALFSSSGLPETEDEARLRHTACFLSDVSWRAHPDYRANQAMNVIANSAFVAVDHPGRAFLALVAVLRHAGPDSEGALPVRGLLSPRLLERARVLSAALRVAYLLTAAMPGVLPRTPLVTHEGRLILSLPPEFADLVSERLASRSKALGRLIGAEAVIEAAAPVL